MIGKYQILIGDVREQLRALPDQHFHCACTSPPYWNLRDYGAEGQIGLEPTPEAYVETMVGVFDEVWRVLRDDGVLFLNIGDSYCSSDKWGGASGGKNDPAAGFPRQKRSFRRDQAVAGGISHLPATGCKPKDLVGIPWQLAFALRAAGWYLRADIIWAKPNPMPESVTDRPTKAHEYVFLLAKSPTYFYDADAIREPVTSTGGASFGPQTKQHIRTADGGHGITPTGDMVQSRALSDPSQRNHPLGRNVRSVWTIATQSFPEAHFATFPEALPERCIKAGTSEKGCCRVCGAPYERIVERTHSKGRTRASGTMVEPPTSLTTGWRPTCDCADAGDPVPCRILDPFLGSGTTVAVACSMGRDGTGIELNPEYGKIAHARINKTVRPQAFVDQRKDDASGTLFAEAGQ